MRRDRTIILQTSDNVLKTGKGKNWIGGVSRREHVTIYRSSFEGFESVNALC